MRRRGTLPRTGYFVPAGNPTLADLGHGLAAAGFGAANSAVFGQLPRISSALTGRDLASLEATMSDIEASTGGQLGAVASDFGLLGGLAAGARGTGKALLQHRIQRKVDNVGEAMAGRVGGITYDSLEGIPSWARPVAELNAFAARDARALLKAGLPPEDIVAILDNTYGSSDNTVMAALANLEVMSPRAKKRAIGLLKGQ